MKRRRHSGQPCAVVVLAVEEPARAYVVSGSDLDTSRVLAWIERPGAIQDLLDELSLLRDTLAAAREAA